VRVNFVTSSSSEELSHRRSDENALQIEATADLNVLVVGRPIPRDAETFGRPR